MSRHDRDPRDLQMSAAERLATSRERIRQSLAASAASLAARGPAKRGTTAPWAQSMKDVPGASIAIEALQAWWQQHPLRATVVLAGDAAKAVVGPLMKKHPFGLVVGALALGGLIAWMRPWRGILKPALFAGLLPQLVSKAVTHIPSDTWIAVVSAMAASAAARATPTPKQATSAPTTGPESSTPSEPTPEPEPAPDAAPPKSTVPGSQSLH